MNRKQIYEQYRLFSLIKKMKKYTLRESQTITQNPLVYTTLDYFLGNVLAEKHLPLGVLIKGGTQNRLK